MPHLCMNMVLFIFTFIWYSQTYSIVPPIHEQQIAIRTDSMQVINALVDHHPVDELVHQPEVDDDDEFFDHHPQDDGSRQQHLGPTQPFYSPLTALRSYRNPTSKDEESIDQMDGIDEKFLAVGDYIKYLDPIFSTPVVSWVTELRNVHGRLEISCNSGVCFPPLHHIAKLVAKFQTDDKWDSSKANAFLLSRFTAACMSPVSIF